MKVNIIISFRPFEGEHAILQDLSLYSWIQQKGCRIIVMDGGEAGVRERCDKYGLQHVDGIKTGKDNGHTTERFMAKSYWEKVLSSVDRDCEYIVYTNADILAMNKGLAPLLRHCTESFGDVWGAFWRRINIVNWRQYVVDNDQYATLENFRDDMWYYGTINFPGMGDVTCWTYKGFEDFIKHQPDVPWDLLGMDRVWLEMHFKAKYKFLEMTYSFPIIHPYHVFSTKQVPDETYDKIFKRKVWPELWENKVQHISAFDCGLIMVDWCDKPKKQEVTKDGN